MDIKQALEILEKEGSVEIQKREGDYIVVVSYFDEDVFLDVRKTFEVYDNYLEWSAT